MRYHSTVSERRFRPNAEMVKAIPAGSAESYGTLERRPSHVCPQHDTNAQCPRRFSNDLRPNEDFTRFLRRADWRNRDVEIPFGQVAQARKVQCVP